MKTSLGTGEILLSNLTLEVKKWGKINSIDDKNDNWNERIDWFSKNIEQSLFHQSNFIKIYDLIDKSRRLKIMEQNISKDLSIREKWENIIIFLSNDLKLKEEMLMLEKFKFEEDGKIKFEKHKTFNVNNKAASKVRMCNMWQN